MATKIVAVCMLLAAVSWGRPADAADAVLPPIPEKAQAELFKDAPAPWREYLIQARAAERLPDPLQRCLAYPDIPGNKWPPGHAKAHCRDHAIKTMTLPEIAAYVDRGDFAGLEGRMNEFLERHFSETDPGEDIHYVLDLFLGAGAEEDRLTQSWLTQAPDSAYANVARANFYRGSAWATRGAKYISETSRKSLQRMTGFVDKAVPLFERAIKLQPRLMPAYVGLLDVAMMDSRDEAEQQAIAGAHAVDPACLTMVKKRMQGLQPRWGGSYERMLAYGYELSEYVESRPQIAIYVRAAYGDRGNRLLANDEYTQQAGMALELAVTTGSNEDSLHDVADLAFNITDGKQEQWKGLAYLLQESRFRETNAWGNRAIAWRLVRAEPEWSLKYSSLAVEQESDNAFGHYLLAAGYYNTRRFDAAEHHYLVALEDSEQRQPSLEELSTMWLFDSDLEPKARVAKARPYIDRLVREYPNYGFGWLLRINEVMISERALDEALIETFLEHADRSDPRQARAVASFESMFRKTDQAIE